MTASIRRSLLIYLKVYLFPLMKVMKVSIHSADMHILGMNSKCF